MDRSSTSIGRVADGHIRFLFFGCTFLSRGEQVGERKRGSIVPPSLAARFTLEVVPELRWLTDRRSRTPRRRHRQRPSDRAERESGRHAECGPKRNEVAGDRRPRIADSVGCGGSQPAEFGFLLDGRLAEGRHVRLTPPATPASSECPDTSAPARSRQPPVRSACCVPAPTAPASWGSLQA
jgi:hypothetical protein